MTKLIATALAAALAATGGPGLAQATGGPDASSAALLPLPQQATLAAGVLPAAGGFQIVWRRAHGAMLERAVARFQDDLRKLEGGQPAPGPSPVLAIDCASDAPSFPSLGEREDYSLDVSAQGVTVQAETPEGVLRGLATLRQLVFASIPSGGALPALHVSDAPRFAWRGVMIDTARHFMSVATLKRQIDAMELTKLNVLHLHLSDNEAFRVESLRYPRLQQVASHGEYYTQSQIRDLVAYAADRGVRIVPEFDVPAHVGALLAAYPELEATAPDPNDPYASVNGTLDPASETTYRVLAELFGEMSALFPDRYIHVGGDEVAAGAWTNVPKIKVFMAARGLATQAELEAYFHRRLREVLARRGKVMVGWEEIAAGPMPKDVVVQAWRTSNATAEATAQGRPTIVSAGYYLDLLMPAAFHYKVDPLDPDADGFTPAEAAAAQKANPLAGAVVAPLVLKPLPPLTPTQQKLVLGAEAALWSELVSDEMLDARLWPRMAALAERFWSPATVRDAADMYRRLAVVQDELRVLGLNDKADQIRMAARLAPGEADPVLTFLETVGPVRNAAHNHTILAALHGQRHPPPQSLRSLADAAPVDSLAARRFEDQARRFGEGDRSIAPMLTHQLQIWRDNNALFAAAAHGRPELEAALPVSSDVAALAQAGLDAIAALQAEQPMDPNALARARAALDRADRVEQASARPIFAFLHPQPAADLIIAITPGVRQLIAATKPSATDNASPSSRRTP